MGTGTNDPLAGKSQALKAALAAVERMNSAAARRTSWKNDGTAENMAPKPVRPAHPTPDPCSAESC
jgi:hypothetical protein